MKQKLKNKGAIKTHKESFLIECLKLVVEAIAGTFGSSCEVVLHDLRNIENLDHSIIKIINGHVTGRKVGGPITDQGLRNLKSGDKETLLTNYRSVTKDGRTLKSSSVIFRDMKGKPIAAVCINLDLTDFIEFNSRIQDIFGITEKDNQGESIETFQNSGVSTLDGIADKAIKRRGKAVSSMGRKEKIEIVKQLDEGGYFLIKGAIKLLALKLNVSKYTIYNYLEQIHTERS
jgi:predicted transcriptional regulator YheO